MKPTLGQAFNKAQTHIYTWYTDGTVTRCEVMRRANGTESSGMEQAVKPPPKHNLDYFLAFVPVAKPNDGELFATGHA